MSVYVLKVVKVLVCGLLKESLWLETELLLELLRSIEYFFGVDIVGGSTR